MEIFRTNPIMEGRYLAFAGAEAAHEWCAPVMLLWHGGKWRFPHSDIAFPRKVYGHSGPIPVGRIADLFPDEPQEFDL